MLPPVDPTILERNPKFEILYKDLQRRKLGKEGETRDGKRERIAGEVGKSLTTSRINHFKTKILLRTLSDLPSKAAFLPPELHSVIELMTAQLSGHILESDRDILSGDVELFLDNITTISDAISEQLITITQQLCKIAEPLNPPSIEALPWGKAHALQEASTKDLPAELADARVELANITYITLALHRDLLSTSIQILEQTQHGALSRATKAKAEYLHARASVLGLQAKIYTHTHPPPAEFVAALKNFKAQQGASEAALRDREGLARRELELYEKAGEKGMRDIAKRAEHLKGEIERIEDEVRKLERGG
ncbi:hypothetical protein BDV95DRAFT_505585 [Massariosphaeria phaeospora]|uniref:Uncharacterized protein n=1 Tax=Massariosphaeria phaeospora TaxID=100035 RepID=A0A7C8I3J8_9PLEO|nr:hypothetical protein BDV95DRAFT_505585 [Massariosphaeria phaeospora]